MKILQVEGSEIGDSQGGAAEGGAGIVDAAPPVEIGEVMVVGTVAQVVSSMLDDLKEGEWVLSANGWQDYAISNGEGVIMR